MKRQYSIQLKIPVVMIMGMIFTISCNKTDKDLPTVTTSGISNKTLNSVTCGGDVTNEGASLVTERGVCWSTFENPTIADSKTSDGAGPGTFTSELSGLSPLDIYFARAYATNSAGTAYGSGISFTTASSDSAKGNFTDPRDGHIYVTQIIGAQTWMAENMAFLPSVSGPETGTDSLPYYYVYGYDSTIVASAKDSANYKAYGVLYNWPAARFACPPGWRLPSKTDWNTLIDTVGSAAGGKLKEIGTIKKDIGKTHWESPNTGATDHYGFDAIPGGERSSTGQFLHINKYAIFWSSEIRDTASTWARHLYFDNDRIDRDWFNNSNGFSVRCIKN